MSRYGRARFAPHIGGGPKTESELPFEASGEHAEKPLSEKAHEVITKTAESAHALTSLASANPIIAGIDVGTKALGAVGDFSKQIADIVNEAKKVQLEIDEKTGALENEIQKNVNERTKMVDNEIKRMAHEQYWHVADFVPKKLSPKRFGLTQDDLYAYSGKTGGKPISDATKEKIQKLEDATEEFVRTKLGFDENYLKKAEVAKQKSLDKQAKENARAARAKLLILIGDAKKQGIDIDKEEVLGDFDKEFDADMKGSGYKRPPKGMTGYGYASDIMQNKNGVMPQAGVKKLYPNPDMMAGMMTK